jgi:hypothetical protein
MWSHPFKSGDLVIFCRTKSTTHPGRRAQNVQATKHGDLYSYVIEKSWIVENVQADGSLMLRTRRGKRHVVAPSDPNLRHATIWDRLRYRARFADLRSTLPTARINST